MQKIQLDIVENEELLKKIKAELLIEDPPLEQGKALLDDRDSQEDSEKPSS